MGLSIGHGLGIPFQKSTSWSSYCTPLTITTAQITGGTRVNWTSQCTSEDGFEIWASIDGGDYILVDTVGEDVLSYDDMTDYGISSVTYRVRAYKGTVYSDFTESGQVANIDSDLTTYITGLATPLSDNQKIRLNTFVKSLKTGLAITNLSEYFDTLYILAGETEESALKNLAKNAHHCTAQNSPAFVQYEGYTGANTKYLDTNYNPSSQGVRFTQNNASYGVYSRTNGDTLNTPIGHYDATKYAFMRLRSSNASYGHLNTNGTPYNNPPCTDSRGMFINTRDGAAISNAYFYINKTNNTTRINTGNTVGLVNNNIYILCRNGNGTAEAFDTSHQISFAFTGKYLTTDERDILVDSFEAYMDANGKGVIA
ncbi:MAG: hypothetical protein GYA62_00700 [Bacteroidales bacterium]|nr:hypothetical protein [Bacteroidales bacterium]